MRFFGSVTVAATILAVLPAQATGQDEPPSTGTISLPGAELPYLVEGEGRPCIVYGSAIYYPRTFSQRFKSHLRCVHVTERGFVAEARRPDGNPFTIAEAVADIEAAREQLGLEDFVLVGHSIHGLIVLAYASEHPNHVSHVVSLGAPPVWPMSSDSIAAYRNRMFGEERHAKHRANRLAVDSLVLAHPDRGIVAQYIANGALYWKDPDFDSTPLWTGVDINPALIDDLFSSTVTWEARPDVAVPVFVGLGAYDFVVPPNLWRGARTPFQDLTVKVFEGAGHTPQLEDSVAFDSQLVEWFGFGDSH